MEILIFAIYLWYSLEMHTPQTVFRNAVGFDTTFVCQISTPAPHESADFEVYSEFFWHEKNETREPWEKYFYCCKRILLVGFSPEKISKKFFWRQIFSHVGCREVVSGTVGVSMNYLRVKFRSIAQP
jgi:hypothetical protein